MPDAPPSRSSINGDTLDRRDLLRASGSIVAGLVAVALAGDGQALLRRRPDVRQAERALAAATATIGVNVAKLYPEITLGGSIASTAPFSFAGSEASLGFSVGPLISWTFPNQRVIRAEIARAGAAADEASARFDATVIEALRQTETALTAYSRQIEEVSALEQARRDAAEADDQAHRLYLYGRTDFINVLTSDAALANADAALAQAQAILVDDQVTVFQTLGGGWQS
jgi:outer membrane protein, multidrug efflux system